MTNRFYDGSVGAQFLAPTDSKTDAGGVSLLAAQVIRIDALLNREEHDADYQAFVLIRRIWPEISAALRTASDSKPVRFEYRYQQGRWEDAGEAYYNFCRKEIEQGNPNFEVRALYEERT